MNNEELIRHSIASSIKAKNALLNDNSFISIIENVAFCIFECIQKGNRVYICGNGGSAADAQHFAAELIGHFHKKRKAYPAVCLSKDAILITALANDYGYENIFSRQLDGVMGSEDILIVISTSGNSDNVLNAVKTAKEHGGKVIALTGVNGGELNKQQICVIKVPSDNAARIQEMHIMIIHIICELIEYKIKEYE